MIRVRIERCPEGRGVAAFTVEGHAGWAPHGRDIVCAGVSALTQAALLGLEEYLALSPNVKVKEGFLHCRLRGAEQKMREAQAILATMELGLRAMAREYPESIKIEEVRA
ncbi:MAG: uncharacterized protein PWQ86_1403 [Bacillota bacterium]|jgi:hypothetical protein|nr:uncharacterized protein [Bacillota bacterium]MDK2960616.1 uncharacterized protein [Bacillota bacterium]